MSFAALKLHAAIERGLKELGFHQPTPIQSDAIPPALEGRDILATAMTGSGKTAAFLLPIIHRLIGKSRGTTRALVLTPTRELAAQIVSDCTALAVHTPITAAPVYGGVGMGPQEHAFRSGVDVIVATPGRLLDHFRAPYARLPALEYLVLDEADRMLDMGFLPDIRRILRHIPTKRQTLFFSATMPPPIAQLAGDMLRHPVVLNVERPALPATGITQAVYPVPHQLKPALLVRLLRDEIQDALVFTRTKHRADRLARHLGHAGINVERIHGNRSQSQRTQALSGFKSGKYRVLVATDIAARGIDITGLGHVVNFDCPPAAEDYVHRVGRTGRAQAVGAAFTFVSPDEEDSLKGIERAIGKRLPRVTLPDFDYLSRPQALEVPMAQRIAEIRQRKRDDRERGRLKAARRAAAQRPTHDGPRTHDDAAHHRFGPHRRRH
ncbi:MAG TPA: DEAD/DEAH box helicase [Vicinamibacterales bacterium]|nr:DEAD/DEAH box helicase [Vicinamibacterales bacterium]